MSKQQAIWYFDVISPFAWLQLNRLNEFDDLLEIIPRPVLLAGLLQHWEHRGPAEIPGKRRFTYRHVQWLAERQGTPIKFPPAHPFNPIRMLRLCLLAGNDWALIRRLFALIWEQGELDDGPAWQALLDESGIESVDSALVAPATKQALRENTDQAISQQVFGVPTLQIGERLYWGLDATDLVLDWLANPDRFESDEYRRVDELPIGVSRV